MNHGSKAKQKYDAAYEARPEQVKKREMRNKARAQLMKEGKVHKGDGNDVDHATPLSAGGSNARSNLRVLDDTRNRGWRRGDTGYKPKKA